MKTNRVKTSAIIVASGVGSRMKTDIPKQFLEVFGKPIIAYTINAISNCTNVDEIVVVTLPDYIVFCNDVVNEFNFKKVSKIICGGSTRQESVRNGLLELSDDTDVVVIHDGARPLVEPDIIKDSVHSALKFGCAAVGVKMKDTVKVVDSDGYILSTADREKLWQVQTPQTFKKDIILSLYKNLESSDIQFTDDCMLAEAAGYKVKIIPGSYENIKITTPQDIFIMKGLLGE